MDQFVANAVPLVGIVEGVVKTRTLAGVGLAAGIPVTLDGGRTAVTNAEGRNFFGEVPEGSLEVALSATELPADFDPGEPAKCRLLVEPRHSFLADLEVLPLSAIEGSVIGPETAPWKAY